MYFINRVCKYLLNMSHISPGFTLEGTAYVTRGELWHCCPVELRSRDIVWRDEPGGLFNAALLAEVAGVQWSRDTCRFEPGCLITDHTKEGL